MQYSVESICRAHGYSRQGYYQGNHVDSKKQREKTEVLAVVHEVRRRQPKVGVRKLQRHIACKNIYIGRDRLFDVLRKEGLLVKKKKKYVRTTQSNHWFKKYSNLVKTGQVEKPEQVYVSDITYIRTREKFCYLSLITDMYSRKIVGWELSESLSIEGSVKALKKAIRTTRDTQRIIHHSDRGIQYCSKEYVRLLKKNGMRVSMTEENHVYENALAERVNGILKDELMLGETLQTVAVAKRMVKEAIETYNEYRLHTSIDYMTPEKKHAA